MYESIYVFTKQLHVAFIAISAVIFCIQYVLTVKRSDWLNISTFKRLPHAINTAILVSGVILIGLSSHLGDNSWLIEKLTCVFAYIALAVFALKMAANEWLRVFAFLGALGWLIMAGNLSATKTPLWF